MSRLYEASTEGRWCSAKCARCAGVNQRMQASSDGGQCLWWWANPTDTVCGLCRCDIEAEEHERHDAEMAEQQWIAEQAERHAGF